MKRHIFLYSCILVLLISCSHQADNREYSAPAYQAEELAPSKENAPAMPRKIIRNGSVRFKTDDTGESYHHITSSVKKFGGYIADERTYDYKTSVGFELTIRVPSEKFDNLLTEITTNENVKKLEEKSTSINDVTEEFIDIEARLKIKKESELKLIDLLKQSKSVSDIISINEQLTNLRSDIESIEGRLKYLENQVSYSTLSVNFYKETKFSSRFISEISNGFSEGWQIFLRLVTLISYLWVIIVIIFIGWRLALYIRKRRRNKNGLI